MTYVPLTPSPLSHTHTTASSPPPSGHTQKRRISLGLPMHPPDGEIIDLQKHLEQFLPSNNTPESMGSTDDIFARSPTPTFTFEEEEEVLYKQAHMSLPNEHHRLATPTRSKRSSAFPFSPSSDFRVVYSSMKQPVKKLVRREEKEEEITLSLFLSLSPSLPLSLPLSPLPLPPYPSLSIRTCSYDAQLNRIVDYQKHDPIYQPTTPQPARKVSISIWCSRLIKPLVTSLALRALRTHTGTRIRTLVLSGVRTSRDTSLAPRVIDRLSRNTSFALRGIVRFSRDNVLTCS